MRSYCSVSAEGTKQTYSLPTPENGGLQYLKFMLQQGYYMCKLYLKDAYFSVSLSKESAQMIHSRWSGNLHEFLCLCFGLDLAQRIFT